MKRRFAIFILLAALVSGAAGAAELGSDFLARVDARGNMMDRDFSGEYTISQNRPGEGVTVTKAVVFRRDRKSQYLVLLVEPVEDVGKGYLLVEGGIWLYDPRDRRFTFTSSQDAFRNTNARNSDFALSTLARQYRVVSSSTEKLGIYPCDKLELAALTKDAPFPKKTVWVSADFALRMSREYSLSGQLLRTVAYQYQRLQDREVPAKVVIVDELKTKTVGGQEQKETTTIAVAKPSFEALPAGLFTKEYLERIGR